MRKYNDSEINDTMMRKDNDAKIGISVGNLQPGDNNGEQTHVLMRN